MARREDFWSDGRSAMPWCDAACGCRRPQDRARSHGPNRGRYGRTVVSRDAARPAGRLGNRKSSGRRPERRIQDASASRVCSVISNCTGRWVFCCMTMARVAMRSPCVTSRTRSLTTSQDLSLLSTARLNRASSRTRSASCRRMRMAQISLRRSGAF